MGKALSLAEELGEAIEAAENDDAAVETPETSTEHPEVAENPETPAQEEASAEVGDKPDTESPEAAEKAGTDQPVVEQDNQAAERSIVAPPATWSASAKAEYAKLPEVVRREISKREQDFARGIQQHAEKAKMADRYLAEFQPYEHVFRAHNVPHEQFIRRALATEFKLMQSTPQQKAQMLLEYAKSYGADLSVIPQLLGMQSQSTNQDQPDINALRSVVGEMVNPVLQKFQSWEQQQMTQRQQQQAQVQDDVNSQVDAFRNATNDDGTPKHLYFENVRELMGAYFANGQAQTLEQAYDMACWANPEVRNALIADQQRKADAQRLAEAQRKARDAKNASFNVSGQGAADINGNSQLSLRDELAVQLDSATSGGRL